MRQAVTALLCCGAALVCDGFTVRRTLTMKRRLLSEGKKKKNKSRKVTLTKVPGITAPENGKLKGWSLEMGEAGTVQFCAATLNERLFVLERDCGCCGWELDKGDFAGVRRPILRWLVVCAARLITWSPAVWKSTSASGLHLTILH